MKCKEMMVFSSNPDLQKYHETFASYANAESNILKERGHFDVAAMCAQQKTIEQNVKVSRARRAITKKNMVQSKEPWLTGTNEFRRKTDIWESKFFSNGLRSGHLGTQSLTSTHTSSSSSDLSLSPELPSPSTVSDLTPSFSASLSLPTHLSPLESLSQSDLPSIFAVTALSSLLASGLPAPSLVFLESLSSSLPSPSISSSQSSTSPNIEPRPTSPNIELGPLILSRSFSSSSNGEILAYREKSSKPYVSNYQQTCHRFSDCLWPSAHLIKNKVRPPHRNGELRVPFMTEEYPWGRFEELEEIKNLIKTGSIGSVNPRKMETSRFSMEKCNFCRLHEKTFEFAETHQLRNPVNGDVTCPILASHVCRFCGATGKKAHTQSHCPRNPERVHMAELKGTLRNPVGFERAD